MEVAGGTEDRSEVFAREMFTVFDIKLLMLSTVDDGLRHKQSSSFAGAKANNLKLVVLRDCGSDFSIVRVLTLW